MSKQDRPIDPTALPYRPCAGMMVVNADGKAFVGQRTDGRFSKWGDRWQMPQGGIDEGEDARTAALRELKEETGISSDKVEIVAQTNHDLFYDLPPELLGKVWKGKYRGQQQSWFLMRFTGSDADIDIHGEHQEFERWKWVDLAQLPELIVPFKKALYAQLLDEFEPLV